MRNKLIDKDALVAWIESQIDSLERNSGCSGIFGEYQMAVYDKLLSFIDTLEAKENNNVWNNASDFSKAEAGRSILVIEDNGRAELLKSPSAERLLYFRSTNLKMWAYVDELLSITAHFDVKEVNLKQEIQQHINDCLDIKFPTTDIKMIAKDVEYTARKFFELGLKVQKGE